MTEIRCTLERKGFIAHYFPGTKENNKAVIVVGGASCKIPERVRRSKAR